MQDNSMRLGYASGSAARKITFQVCQATFGAQNAEHLNKPLGGFLHSSYDKVTIMNTEITIGIVSATVALISVVISVFGQLRTTKLEHQLLNKFCANRAQDAQISEKLANFQGKVSWIANCLRTIKDLPAKTERSLNLTKQS